MLVYMLSWVNIVINYFENCIEINLVFMLCFYFCCNFR